MMECLIDGQPGRHECWEELANASLDHDDMFPAGSSGRSCGTRPDYGRSRPRWISPQPDLSSGLCVTGQWLPADAWTSDDPGLREKARQVCLRCPVLDPCRQWALSLPVPGRAEAVIIGGTTWADRDRAKRKARRGDG